LGFIQEPNFFHAFPDDRGTGTLIAGEKLLLLAL